MATDITMDIPATQAAPVASAWRKRLPLVAGAALVIAAAVWGGRKYVYALTHESTDNAQLDGHITVIAPKVQAFVARVLVDDNQHVKAGDTLVVLDGRDLDVRLKQAEADLANAQATAGSAGGAGQAVYDAAAGTLESARKQLAGAGDQVSAYGAALSGAGARLAAAAAAEDNARLQASYAYILAPSEGIVAKRSAEVGALVQPGQTLMSIVPDRDVWVTANLKETQLEHVAVGDKATFTVDAYPGHVFHGHVESLSPATGARFSLLPPDNATGNFTKVVQRVPVRIAVDDPPDPARPLRPGMSAVVDIATK